MIIEGAIAVKAVINNHKRDIKEVYIDKQKKTKDFNYIRKICKENNIELKELEKEELNNYLIGKTNGGIGAEVSLRKEDEFIDGDIFYLAGIEDPFNIGYALRTLYALGINNVLLDKKDYSKMDSQILKSSAGALEMLKIKYIEGNKQDLNQYKDNGYYLYGLFRDDKANDIFDCDFKDKSLFILGGEKRGINKEILNICDEYLYISYGNDFRNALNASAAIDVVATLRYKQKRK